MIKLIIIKYFLIIKFKNRNIFYIFSNIIKILTLVYSIIIIIIINIFWYWRLNIIIIIISFNWYNGIIDLKFDTFGADIF